MIVEGRGRGLRELLGEQRLSSGGEQRHVADDGDRGYARSANNVPSQMAGKGALQVYGAV